MKGIVYRKYHIIGTAHLNERTGYWVPTVRVKWRETGREQTFTLEGPQNRFRSQAEAEDHAIMMGKDWIDKKNPLP